MQIIAGLPFLFMIFFSTTFSPGAGVEGIKFLRFLFARFYFWCDVPGYSDLMEGCPPQDDLVLYTVLSGSLGLLLFLAGNLVLGLKAASDVKKRDTGRAAIESSVEFQKLQRLLFGADLIPVSSDAGVGAKGFEPVATSGDEKI